MIPDILAGFVIFLEVPVLGLIALMLARRAIRRSELHGLRGDAFASIVLVLVVIVFAGIFLNNGMEEPILDLYATRILTRGALLALLPPALNWLWIHRKR